MHFLATHMYGSYRYMDGMHFLQQQLSYSIKERWYSRTLNEVPGTSSLFGMYFFKISSSLNGLVHYTVSFKFLALIYLHTKTCSFSCQFVFVGKHLSCGYHGMSILTSYNVYNLHIRHHLDISICLMCVPLRVHTYLSRSLFTCHLCLMLMISCMGIQSHSSCCIVTNVCSPAQENTIIPPDPNNVC